MENKMEKNFDVKNGKYGVTRTQMLEAINNAFNEENVLDILKMFYNKYRDVFVQTIRYISVDKKQYIQNNIQVEFDNIVPAGKYGVTKTQLCDFFINNIDNKEMIIKAFEQNPVLANNSIRYMKKSIRDKIAEYLSEKWKFKNNYKTKNNGKLATMIRQNMSIIDNFTELEMNMAKDVCCNDESTANIAKKYNVSVYVVYNMLFRTGKNSKSLLAKYN